MGAPGVLPEVPGYRLGAVLRTGGMSTIYAAEATEGAACPSGGLVAIKLLHPQLLCEVELVMRFHNETALLLAMKSACLVKAHGSGRLSDGTPYLVLERLSHSLADLLDARAEGLPEKDALQVGRVLAAAVAELHAYGITHRDLKPPNIMFAKSGLSALRLIDLGLAKIDPLAAAPSGERPLPILPVSTADATLLGTYEYMAPEQYLSPKKTRASADVYSLGVILYQLLTGRLPFYDSSTKRLIGKHLWEPPPLGLVRRPVVRRLLADLLSKEPEARPTAAEACARIGLLLSAR